MSAAPPEVLVARPEDLATWDDVAVRSPEGNVKQSLAWGRHRERQGWRPLHLLAGGVPALVLTRPWRGIGGMAAYLPRGPIEVGGVGATADRVAAIVAFLGERGADVVTVDPEIPAATGFADRLVAQGFRPIEELEPSRHRLDVALPSDPDALLPSFSATTRNLVRQARKQGLVVRRLDRSGGAPAEGVLDVPGRGPRADGLIDAFLDVVAETADRRGFALARRTDTRAWTETSLDAGHALALLVEDAVGAALAGALLYRHGRRLTYALAGERESARRSHPGATRLLIAEAMAIAVREGRAVMDLGGVDARGSRRPPVEGEPKYGLLQFKRSFGAEWVQMAGAHELTLRPWRYVAGRAVNRLVRG